MAGQANRFGRRVERLIGDASLRSAASTLGLTKSTLSRVIAGGIPDIYTFSTLVRHYEIDPRVALKELGLI